MVSKHGPTIPVTENMILTGAEDANVILLGGDLPQHADESAWDYHARVRDEIQRRMTAEAVAMIDAVLASYPQERA